MKPMHYALGVLAAITTGTILSNEYAGYSDRKRVETLKARPITDDLVIHRFIVPSHKARSTPLVTITYHAADTYNAGFSASVTADDGTTVCSNTSGKGGGGMQFPSRMTPVLRVPLAKLTGPECQLPPGSYSLAVRFNVLIDGVVKSISAESERFRVTE